MCGAESAQVRVHEQDGIIFDFLKVQLGAASVDIMSGITFTFCLMKVRALSLAICRLQVLSSACCTAWHADR